MKGSESFLRRVDGGAIAGARFEVECSVPNSPTQYISERVDEVLDRGQGCFPRRGGTAIN
jgi:hypothetical protein